jgi:hypothetical protein
MRFEVLVDVVLLKHDGDGEYSILLHDSDGQGNGWELPGGDIFEMPPDLDLSADMNLPLELSCFQHLFDDARIKPEWVEEMPNGSRCHQFQFYVTGFGGEHTSGVVVHYGILDSDFHDEVETAMKEKCGNARFFPVSDLPELKYDEHADAIEKLMANFKQKSN